MQQQNKEICASTADEGWHRSNATWRARWTRALSDIDTGDGAYRARARGWPMLDYGHCDEYGCIPSRSNA